MGGIITLSFSSSFCFFFLSLFFISYWVGSGPPHTNWAYIHPIPLLLFPPSWLFDLKYFLFNFFFPLCRKILLFVKPINVIANHKTLVRSCNNNIFVMNRKKLKRQHNNMCVQNKMDYVGILIQYWNKKQTNNPEKSRQILSPCFRHFSKSFCSESQCVI